MAVSKQPEFWLRGPVEGIPSYLQPIAHALLQARDEINGIVAGFPSHLLWEKPRGVASVGFHLQHLKGVLDRLFTYAKGRTLSEEQMAYLKGEGDPGKATGGLQELTTAFNGQVDKALTCLRGLEGQDLLAFRGVGRAQLPSTVLGLLFHAAEHTMRHTGQLLVTARVLKAGEGSTDQG